MLPTPTFTSRAENIRRASCGCGSAAAIIDAMAQIAQSYQTPVTYPQSPLGQSLHTIAQVIAGDVGTRVFFAKRSGKVLPSHGPTAKTNVSAWSVTPVSSLSSLSWPPTACEGAACEAAGG